MSITITDAPIQYSPVYSPCIYVVNEPTLTSQRDFRYIAEIYVGGAKVVELKSFPHPTDNWGKFDISTTLQQYVETQSNFEDNIYSNSGITTDAEVQFGWSYIDVNGNFVRVENNVRNTRTYFNGSPFYNEFVDLRSNPTEHPYLITDYQIGDYDKYPITSKRLIETARGTKQWLTYMADDWTNLTAIEIQQTDSGPFSDTIDLPAGLQNNTDGKVVSFRVDPDVIEAGTTLTDLKEYRIRTIDTISDETSDWIEFKVLPCNRWSLYSLYYLNRWGGIDSFSFDGRSTIQYGSQSETYKVDTEQVSSAGVVSYDNTRHSVRNYHTEQVQVYQLTSSWIDHSSKQSAIDLQASPQVWIETPDNVILPVTIEQESFELIDNNNTEPIYLSMSVRFSQPTKRQKI